MNGERSVLKQKVAARLPFEHFFIVNFYCIVYNMI